MVTAQKKFPTSSIGIRTRDLWRYCRFGYRKLPSYKPSPKGQGRKGRRCSQVTQRQLLSVYELDSHWSIRNQHEFTCYFNWLLVELQHKALDDLKVRIEGYLYYLWPETVSKNWQKSLRGRVKLVWKTIYLWPPMSKIVDSRWTLLETILRSL